MRDTDEALVELIGASLETFTATTFAAQGDLDRFTAAAPAQRRRLLGEILRLDRFAVLEATVAATERAAVRIRDLEDRIRRLRAQRRALALAPGQPSWLTGR